jgi:hypothetical protein
MELLFPGLGAGLTYLGRVRALSHPRGSFPRVRRMHARPSSYAGSPALFPGGPLPHAPHDHRAPQLHATNQHQFPHRSPIMRHPVIHQFLRTCTFRSLDASRVASPFARLPCTCTSIISLHRHHFLRLLQLALFRSCWPSSCLPACHILRPTHAPLCNLQDAKNNSLARGLVHYRSCTLPALSDLHSTRPPPSVCLVCH